jgi:hypothetical protein
MTTKKTEDLIGTCGGSPVTRPDSLTNPQALAMFARSRRAKAKGQKALEADGQASIRTTLLEFMAIPARCPEGIVLERYLLNEHGARFGEGIDDDAVTMAAAIEMDEAGVHLQGILDDYACFGEPPHRLV